MSVKSFSEMDYDWLATQHSGWAGDYSITASVVIPTYNMKQIVEKTLCGLRIQTYPTHLYEVIVTDDGSNDGIEDLVNVHARFFSNFHFARQQHEGYRLASVRNNGIRLARNDVVILLDGDVLPVPELIEAHLRWFHIHDGLATIGYLKYIDASSVSPEKVLTSIDLIRALPDYPSATNWGAKLDKRLPEFANFGNHPHPYNCFHGGNVAFRRQHALDIGLFDEDFNGHWGYEDMEFAYRLWKSGRFLIVEAAALGLHQEHPSLSIDERLRQKKVNFEKMSRKVPGFKGYRQSIGQ